MREDTQKSLVRMCSIGKFEGNVNLDFEMWTSDLQLNTKLRNGFKGQEICPCIFFLSNYFFGKS